LPCAYFIHSVTYHPNATPYALYVLLNFSSHLPTLSPSDLLFSAI
jgi:hypothetical protein